MYDTSLESCFAKFSRDVSRTCTFPRYKKLQSFKVTSHVFSGVFSTYTFFFKRPFDPPYGACRKVPIAQIKAELLNFHVMWSKVAA